MISRFLTHCLPHRTQQSLPPSECQSSHLGQCPDRPPCLNQHLPCPANPSLLLLRYFWRLIQKFSDNAISLQEAILPDEMAKLLQQNPNIAQVFEQHSGDTCGRNQTYKILRCCSFESNSLFYIIVLIFTCGRNLPDRSRLNLAWPR